MYNCQGSVIASTDADGMVKLWDTRMVAEILTIQAGKYPANKATWDPSGQVNDVARGISCIQGCTATHRAAHIVSAGI